MTRHASFRTAIENMINGRFVLPNLRNIYTSFSAECLYLLLHSFSAENMEHIDLVDFSIAVDTDLVLLPYNTSLSFRWTSLDAKLDANSHSCLGRRSTSNENPSHPSSPTNVGKEGYLAIRAAMTACNYR